MNISITHDKESCVWIAECEEAGLVLEAESYDELIDKTKDALLDLIELNHLPESTVFTITSDGGEKKLYFGNPVEVSVDQFYSEKNMQYLRDAVEALNAGKGAEHELLEEE